MYHAKLTMRIVPPNAASRNRVTDSPVNGSIDGPSVDHGISTVAPAPRDSSPHGVAQDRPGAQLLMLRDFVDAGPLAARARWRRGLAKLLHLLALRANSEEARFANRKFLC